VTQYVEHGLLSECIKLTSHTCTADLHY